MLFLIVFYVVLFLENAYGIIQEVNIGGMFPLLTLAGEVDYKGIQYGAAIYMAIREINNKNDGILDNLLPNTTLKLAIRSPRRSFLLAVTTAIALSTTVFNGAGVSAVIGPVASSACLSSGQMYAQYNIPQISYGAAVSDLSDKVSYPTFVRTVPADNYQGIAIADLARIFHWTKVTVFSTTDTYGSGTMTEFQIAAKSFGIQILSSHTFRSGSMDFDDMVHSAHSVGSLIFLFFMTASDAGHLLEYGYNSGLFGKGTQVIGTDQTLSAVIWQSMSHSADIPAIMKGFLGIRPSFTYQTPYGQKFMRRWRAQQNSFTKSLDGRIICSDDRDDDGGFRLYQDRLNATSPWKCATLNYSNFKQDGSDTSQYVAYTYDSVVLVATALHHLIYKHKVQRIDTTTLLRAIANTSISGVTGNITLNSMSMSYGGGDRISDISYELLNFQYSTYIQNSGNSGFNIIGNYKLETGLALCNIVTDTKCRSVIYNTDNNNVPLDTPLPVTEVTPQVLANAYIAVAVICLLIVISLQIFVIIYRKKRKMLVCQPELLSTILFGGVIGSFRILNSSFPISDASCVSGLWLAHMAFFFVFGALLCKLWRASMVSYKIVNVSSMDTLLMKRFIAMLVVMVSYLAVVTMFGRYHKGTVSVDTGRRQTLIREKCFEDNPIFSLVLLVMELVSLLYGWYLCWKTKNAAIEINESKYIAFATYVIIFVCAMAFPVVYLLSLTPVQNVMVATMAFGFSLLSVMAVMFIPKMVLMWEDVQFVIPYFMKVAAIMSSSASVEVPSRVTPIPQNGAEIQIKSLKTTTSVTNSAGIPLVRSIVINKVSSYA